MFLTRPASPPVCAAIIPLTGWHIRTLATLAQACLRGQLVVIDTDQQRTELAALHSFLAHATHMRLSVREEPTC